MTKEKKILKNYILYFLTFIFICIIGISNVLAWDWTNANGITYTAIGYVTNDTQIQLEVTYETGSGAPLPVSVDQTVNTEIKTLYINLSNYTFLANTRYEIELNLPNNKLVYANTYSVQGSNGEQCMISLSDSVFNDEYSRWDFQCPSATNTISISVYNSNNTAITTMGIFSWHYSHLYSSTMPINSSTTNNNDLINNANQNADRIIDNQNQNTQDIINNQNQNSQNIQNTINNNFQTCIDSPNIINLEELKKTSNWDSNTQNGFWEKAVAFIPRTNSTKYYLYARLKPGKTRIAGIEISLSSDTWNSGNGRYRFLIRNGETSFYSDNYSFNSNKVYMFITPSNTNITQVFEHYDFMVSEEPITEYIQPGIICTNKLDEQNKTSKGILGKLGDLLDYINPTSENFFVYKLIELLGDLLKELFIPSGEYLSNWYSDFREWIELKLGFLATPITLFLDFINLYLNLEEGDLIINIPQITVPNFEEFTIIQAQTLNWGQLLRSKTELLNLWNLYLDFIDVYLILNFLGLCEMTYNRIFGGDTSQYEYYTTEDTYTINDETGEATNHQLRQRRTRREKL